MAEISPVFAAYIIFDIDSLCTSRTSFRGSILFVSEYTCISYSTWTLVYGYAFEQMANLVEDLALQIFLWLRYKITAVIKYDSILLKTSSEATTLRVAIFQLTPICIKKIIPECPQSNLVHLSKTRLYLILLAYHLSPSETQACNHKMKSRLRLFRILLPEGNHTRVSEGEMMRDGKIGRCEGEDEICATTEKNRWS